MKQRNLFLLIFGLVLSCAAVRAQDVVIIVNNGVKAATASSDDIRGVFIGEKVRRERRWTSAGANPARELVRSTR